MYQGNQQQQGYGYVPSQGQPGPQGSNPYQQQQQQGGRGGDGGKSLTQDQLNANVKASIQREQSIVVPTMSQSMLHEFNEKNTQRMERMTIGRGPPPARPTAPTSSSTNPFDSIDLQNGRDKAAEDLQLVGVIKGYLKRRREETTNPGPAEVADVSNQVKAITGNSWTTHWQPVHGHLIDFIKAHPESFTLVRNKYVTLAGFEHEAEIPPLESSFSMQTPPAAPEPPAQSTSYDYYNQQHQAPPPSTYQYDPNPYYEQQNPYQYHQQPESMYGGANPYGYDSNPFMTTQPPAPPPQYVPMYENQQQFPHIPFPQNDVPVYDPSLGGAGGTTADDDWVLFDDEVEVNTPITFASFNTTTTSTMPPATTDWMNMNMTSSTYPDTNPLSMFESNGAAAEKARQEEEERKARKAKRKEEKRKKKQISEDEALARQLQEQEDARLASQMQQQSGAASAPRQSNGSGGRRSQTFNPSHTPSGDRVSLTATEVRELAESEIGKDNIRIMAGFSVIKFGREGRPHQRKMWINNALTHLAWESTQFGACRGLELAKVIAIKDGEMTPTIRRATKDHDKVAKLCFSLETHARTLDLQACSVIQKQTLVEALRKVVEFNHRHKPRRIDKHKTELYL